MRIYCAGPIRGDTTYSSYYRDIIRFVEKLGHIPLTELALPPEDVSSLADQAIYRRDREWLDEAGAMVAEVSGPSLGVGYEIAYALHVRKIPVLCLRHCSAKTPSAMIAGNVSELLWIESYDSHQEIEKIVKKFLKSIEFSKQ